MIRVLKSKIDTTVDACNVKYEGSITIPKKLAQSARLVEYEEVFVHGVNKRIRTYVLFGDTDEIQMNGNAAYCFVKGEKIHILSFIGVKIPGIEPIIIKA